MASEENIGKLYRIAQEEHGERINYESFRESLMRSISADLNVDEMIIKMLETSEGVSIGTYKNGIFIFSNEVIKTAEKLVIEDAKKKEIYETDDKIDVDVIKEIIEETQPRESKLKGFSQMSFEQQMEFAYDYDAWTKEDVITVQEEIDEFYKNLPNNPNLTPEQQKSAEVVREAYRSIENDVEKSFDIYLKTAQNFQGILFSNAPVEKKRKMYEEYLVETRKMLKDNFEILQKSDASDEDKKKVYDRLEVTTGMKAEYIKEAIQEFGYDLDEWVQTLANFVTTPVSKKDFETAKEDSVRWGVYGATKTAKHANLQQEVCQMFEKPGLKFDNAQQVMQLFNLEKEQKEQIWNGVWNGVNSRFEDLMRGVGANPREALYQYERDLEALDPKEYEKDYGNFGKYLQTPTEITRIFEMLDRIRTEGKKEVENVTYLRTSTGTPFTGLKEKPVTDKEFSDSLVVNRSKMLYEDRTFADRVLKTSQMPFQTTYKSPAERLEAALKKNDKIPMDGLPRLKYSPTNVTRHNPLVVETIIVDTEPLKPIQSKFKISQETPVPPVVEEVVTQPIEEPYGTKPNMSDANVVPTPPVAEVVEPENVHEEPEATLPVNITLGDKIKRGFNTLGNKMKAVLAAIVSNDKAKGLFARVSDALAGSTGSSDATSTSSTSSAGQRKEAQAVDYLNQHFDINVKAAREAAIASQEAATKETKAVDEMGDETK